LQGILKKGVVFFVGVCYNGVMEIKKDNHAPARRRATEGWFAKQTAERRLAYWLLKSKDED